MALSRNVGGIDKTVRIILGLVLIAVGLFADLGTTWTIIVYAVAVIALLTALLSYCPINTLLGINTRARKSTP